MNKSTELKTLSTEKIVVDKLTVQLVLKNWPALVSPTPLYPSRGLTCLFERSFA